MKTTPKHSPNTALHPEPDTGLNAAPFLPGGTFTGDLLVELLAPARCRALAADLEQRGFAPTGTAYPAGYRNNDRLVFDSPELAAELWALAAARVPPELTIDGVRWVADALNTRFRACRYSGGQAFTIHRDGAYASSPDRRSWLTLQIYLNESFEGGRTRFYGDAAGRVAWAAITPRAGDAVVFDHRAWHDGEAVPRGTKMVVRTDVMYRRAGVAGSVTSSSALGSHPGYVWRVLELADGCIASSGRDGCVRIWGRTPRVMDLARGSVLALAQSGDARLWCGTRSGEIMALRDADAASQDSRSGDQAKQVQSTAAQVHVAGAAVLDIAAWGDRIVAALASGEVLCLEQNGRELWRRAVHTGWAWGVVAHGAEIVSCGEDGRLVALDSDGGARVLAHAPVPLRALARLSTGVKCDDPLITGGADGVVRAYAAEAASAGTTVWEVAAHDGACVALDARGAAWASGGEDGQTHLWRGRTRAASWSAPDFIRSVRIARDGAVLRGGYDGAVMCSPGPTAPSVASRLLVMPFVLAMRRR